MSTPSFDPSHLEDPTVPLAPEPAAATASIVDRIRATHQAKGRAPLRLAIPQWDGDVLVAFGPLAAKQLTAAAKVGRRQPRIGNAQMLATACKEILLLDPTTGDYVPAGRDHDIDTVRFDGHLADMFDLPGDSPNEIVMAMYADDVAMAQHAKQVYEWQTGAGLTEMTSEEIDDAAGEANAAT